MGLSRRVAPPFGACQFCGCLELRERDWHGVEQPQKANAADSDPTHQTCLLEAQNFDAQINVLFFFVYHYTAIPNIISFKTAAKNLNESFQLKKDNSSMSDSEDSDSEPEYLSKTLEELLKEAELSDPESDVDENLSTVKGSNGARQFENIMTRKFWALFYSKQGKNQGLLRFCATKVCL